MTANLVILISGSGSNLQAFIDAIQNKQINANISLVISNKEKALGLERAAAANIPTAVLNHNAFSDRAQFDQALIKQIDTQKPDAVILAGFMRILSETFVNHYLGKLFNIHPSLLPKYPGLHTHERAIAASDKEAGATVHFVVPELDAGPLIIQAAVPVCSNDTPSDLAQRVLVQEHKIYPLALQWFLEKRLLLTPKGATLDSIPLPASGFIYTDPINAGTPLREIQ